MEHPAAVALLADEFSRAGADITQTFTYYSRDVGTPEGCELTVGGRRRVERVTGDCAVQCLEINTASCSIARAAADKWGTIVAGGVVQTSAYRQIRYHHLHMNTQIDTDCVLQGWRGQGGGSPGDQGGTPGPH